MMDATDRQAVFESVTKLMADLFGIDRARLTPDARFEDLELTSLDAIDLVVELQRLTGRKVGGRLRDVRTIGDIVTLVQDHLAKGGRA
jgi:acyl carrier protein